MSLKKHSTLHAFRECVALGALLLLSALISLELARGDGRIAAMWLPNAVAVVWLMWRPQVSRWAGMATAFAANFAAAILANDPPLRAAGLAFANLLEIGVAVTLLTRTGVRLAKIAEPAILLRLLAVGGVVAPTISSIVAVQFLPATPVSPLRLIMQWIAADGLAMILFVPTASILLRALGQIRPLSRSEALEWCLLTLGGTSVVVTVFLQSRYPLLFLVTPVVLVHALRHGLLGTAISTVKIAIIAIIATSAGSGPIMLTPDPWMRIIVLQLFLLSVFLMGIPIAALLTRQRRTADSLLRRDQQLSFLAASMSDAVLVFDRTQKCRYAAGASAELFARAEAGIVGSMAADLVESADRKRFCVAMDSIVSGRAAAQTITFRRPRLHREEQLCFLEARLAATRNDDLRGDFAVIASFRDVSERVALERDLVAARERAEQAALAKSQFLANMSHEIRTPMNGVLGFAELLEQELTDPEHRQQIGLIVESGQSMMRLLNDILDLSKVDAGLLTVCDEPVDLRQFLDGCVSINRAQSSTKGIELDLAIDPQMPGLVVIDPLRTRQIVLNLLGNAIKFTDKGGVKLIATADSSRLRIEVEDSGIGIPESRIEAIFQPFEQADNTTARKYGGTGLGLAISHQLARLLGGSLTAKSKLGHGSRFILDLPLVVGSATASEAKLRRPKAEASPRLLASRNCRVLLADDQEINRHLAKSMIERLGFRVDTVVNGSDAIAAILKARTSHEPYALVLMDIQMPVIDGYQAARIIRNNGFDADSLPIVALTANAYPDDVRAALRSGMQDHLAKPLSIGRLRTVLESWLPSETGSEGGATPTNEPSARLESLWQETRQAAITAAEQWLACNPADRETAAPDLQNVMHRLAGTAHHFGEDQMGEAAGRIDRALASGDLRSEIEGLVFRFLMCASDVHEDAAVVPPLLRKSA